VNMSCSYFPQANATVAKAQEEVKTLKNRIADTRAAKEELARDLTMAQYEANIVAREYQEVGDSVRLLLCMVHASLVIGWCFYRRGGLVHLALRKDNEFHVYKSHFFWGCIKLPL